MTFFYLHFDRQKNNDLKIKFSASKGTVQDFFDRLQVHTSYWTLFYMRPIYSVSADSAEYTVKFWKICEQSFWRLPLEPDQINMPCFYKKHSAMYNWSLCRWGECAVLSKQKVVLKEVGKEDNTDLNLNGNYRVREAAKKKKFFF